MMPGRNALVALRQRRRYEGVKLDGIKALMQDTPQRATHGESTQGKSVQRLQTH